MLSNQVNFKAVAPCLGRICCFVCCEKANAESAQNAVTENFAPEKIVKLELQFSE